MLLRRLQEFQAGARSSQGSETTTKTLSAEEKSPECKTGSLPDLRPSVSLADSVEATKANGRIVLEGITERLLAILLATADASTSSL